MEGFATSSTAIVSSLSCPVDRLGCDASPIMRCCTDDKPTRFIVSCTNAERTSLVTEAGKRSLAEKSNDSHTVAIPL